MTKGQTSTLLMVTFSEHFDFLSTYFYDLWAKISSPDTLIEMCILIGIFCVSYVLQKCLQRYHISHASEEKRSKFLTSLINVAIAFSQPISCLFLIALAKGISSHFTENLEVYQLGVHLSSVWLFWVFAIHIIPDAFVRVVLSCTLIPFLILWTLGLSDPVIAYLDSLSFNLGVTQVSVLLILKILLFTTCFLWFSRLINETVRTFIDSQKKLSLDVRDLMQNLFQVVFYTIISLITLDVIGIDLKSLTLLGGAIGIGIGLGLQKIAANFISSIIILFEQNIKVGHFVEIAGSGSPGWIRHLGARATVIDMGDGRELLIPNEELLTKTVVDWTSRDTRARTDLRIKVSFDSDLENAKKIMIDAALSHPMCSKKSPPAIYLEKFTDNGAQFLLQFWVDNLSVGKMDMQNDVLLNIWRKFAKANIHHPLPIGNILNA